MKEPILIIGSNSFAGSNFIDYLLNKKLKVIGVSRSKEINKIFLKYKYNKNYKKNFSTHQINLKTICPYCNLAKRLLKSKKLNIL